MRFMNLRCEAQARRSRSQVEAVNYGKIVAINIKTRDFEEADNRILS
jgi:hypothetical protein